MSQTLGRYRLLSLLATGGMGEVFLARQEGPAGFSKTVVIKRILRHLANDQGFIEQFLNEARLAAQLQHPNIAQVFGLEHEAQSWFIAMEHVHGKSVRAVVDQAVKVGTPVPPALGMRVCSQVLQGLQFAHELTDDHGQPLGILHRDVTPENVLVSFSGGVKLVDFGIAKAMSGAATRTGRPKGKLPYMAPELTVSGASVDRRADVYGAGLVLRELLTLRPPTEPGSLDALPPGLADIVRRAVALEPERRYASALEMSRALEDWLTSHGHTVLPDDVRSFLLMLFGPAAADSNAAVSAEDVVPAGTQPLQSAGGAHVTSQFRAPVLPDAAPPPTLAPPRRSGWLFLVVAGLAAALGGVGVWSFRSPPPAPPPVVEPPPPVVVAPPPALVVAQPVAPLPVVSPPPVEPVVPPPHHAVPRTGKVIVRVNPWAEVAFGGRTYGVTPLEPIEVPAGSATFTLRNSQLGVTRKVTVHVPAGGSVMLKADLFTR